MDMNIVYYSNKEERGSRIARDFMTKIMHNLKDNLQNDDFIQFVSDFRVPNERELYGVFIKSLMGVDNVGYIATEVQIDRDEAKGRIDFLTVYRDKVFIFELKVTRVGIRTKTNTDRSQKPWSGVVQQLHNLDLENKNNPLQKVRGRRQVIFCPVVIYFYCTYDNENEKIDRNDIEALLKESHGHISSQISEDHNKPDFEMLSKYDDPIITLRRQGEINSTQVYGFTVFAAATPKKLGLKFID